MFGPGGKNLKFKTRNNFSDTEVPEQTELLQQLHNK
jgi:hypothetical protein